MQKAKDNKGKKPFWRQNLIHKKQNTKDEVRKAKDKSQNNKKYISTYITPRGVLSFFLHP